MKKLSFLIGILFINTILLSKNIVITSIQPTYSLVSYLLKDTNIEVFVPFGSDISMTISKEAIQDSEFDLKIAKESQAVVDIAKIWSDDTIYGKARRENIHIIEIDATYSYDEKMPTLFFNEYDNGKINPYVWTGSKNIIKMANIVSKDLIVIYPQEKEKIEKNLLNLNRLVINLEKEANEKLINCSSMEVISLTENLQYLFNDLNIFPYYEKIENIDENKIKELIKKTGIKTVVSDRWIKKNIIHAIEEVGGKFIVLDTLDIPYDSDEKMDTEALLKAYKNNVNKLITSLTN